MTKNFLLCAIAGTSSRWKIKNAVPLHARCQQATNAVGGGRCGQRRLVGGFLIASGSALVPDGHSGCSDPPLAGLASSSLIALASPEHWMRHQALYRGTCGISISEHLPIGCKPTTLRLRYQSRSQRPSPSSSRGQSLSSPEAAKYSRRKAVSCPPPLNLRD